MSSAESQIWPPQYVAEAKRLAKEDIRGVGINNASLDASIARITRGNSWKRQRIVMVLPTANLIPAEVVMGLLNLAFPMNQSVYRYFALGQEVGEAYSKAFDEILAHPVLGKWDYILTIEHDTVPEWNSLLRLLERIEEHHEFTAISALYWTRCYEGKPQIWGDPSDPVVNFRPQPPRAGELVECNGIGMGFALWRMQRLRDKRLSRPFFKTAGGTQDLYFWKNARQHGHRCAVDCAVPVGHYDKETEVIW